MNGSSTSMVMTPWLHFGNSDYLIFETWRPSSHGAIAGACIGLFLFCILERGLVAYRRCRELRWRARAPSAPSSIRSRKDDDAVVPKDDSIPPRRRLIPSCVPSQDILRGVILAIQSIFSYSIMLTVMTFNAAYILSIIIGLSTGEVLFGRIGRK